MMVKIAKYPQIVRQHYYDKIIHDYLDRETFREDWMNTTKRSTLALS